MHFLFIITILLYIFLLHYLKALFLPKLIIYVWEQLIYYFFCFFFYYFFNLLLFNMHIILVINQTLIFKWNFLFALVSFFNICLFNCFNLYFIHYVLFWIVTGIRLCLLWKFIVSLTLLILIQEDIIRDDTDFIINLFNIIDWQFFYLFFELHLIKIVIILYILILLPFVFIIFCYIFLWHIIIKNIGLVIKVVYLVVLV